MTNVHEHITAEDKKAAQIWVLRMLDEPDLHARGLADWIAEKPTRQALYADFMNDVQTAGQAAASFQTHALPPRQRQRPWWAKPMPVLAAASILGLLASASMVWRSPSHVAPHVQEASLTSSVVTRLGEVRTVHLADGSRAILDTDTVLGVSMVADSRTISLKRGRARFIVAHDSARPFYVRAGGIQVRATGTVFDVLFRNTVAVHLVEGGVEVQVLANAAQPAKTIALKPGQILTLRHGQSPQSLVMPARRSDQQWVSGVKSFDNVPIREVIVEANSYSDSKIELVPPSLGEREIFAEIDIRDIERVAEAISGYLDLTIDRSQKHRLILASKK
ncbi:FecR family protein [Sphingobium sp. HWE2-09]|uniref:FecR family protein n=1 Tax=Sphingobium sp. HWE2-09 TaxID=3108390 RepID=UPI002DD22315|nr:FecR domain-containing protein [Sphingobium sp. HWE2-09]